MSKLYEIQQTWKQSQRFLNEYGHGGRALEETVHIDYQRQLEDAIGLLPIYAGRIERERGVAMKRTSDKRFYGSDGEVSFELYIREIEDEDAPT